MKGGPAWTLGTELVADIEDDLSLVNNAAHIKKHYPNEVGEMAPVWSGRDIDDIIFRSIDQQPGEKKGCRADGTEYPWIYLCSRTVLHSRSVCCRSDRVLGRIYPQVNGRSVRVFFNGPRPRRSILLLVFLPGAHDHAVPKPVDINSISRLRSGIHGADHGSR